MSEDRGIAAQPPGEAGPALTEVEAALVATVLAGQPADLAGAAVGAGVVRDLLLEARPGWRLPPSGLRIANGIIEGALDLEGCTLVRPLLLTGVQVRAPGSQAALDVRDARLKHIGLDGVTLDGAILGDRLHVESGLVAVGCRIAGAVYLRGGRIDGALTLEGSALGDGRRALRAAGLRVVGPLNLRQTRSAGEIALPRARLGALYAEEAAVTGAAVALNAKSARIDGDILLDGIDLAGALGLNNARISGKADASRARIAALPSSVLADGVTIRQGLRLDGARMRGTIELSGAVIGRRFTAADLEVEGAEAAIRAEVIRVGGNWEMPRARLVGHLAITGATIGGQLRLTEARLFGSDVAIRADGARVRGGCFFSRATIVGLVRFPAADISNQFRMRGATIKVDHGAALLAAGATFRRDVELSHGFQTVGAVVLEQARVAGALDLRASHLKSAAIARLGGAPPGPARARAEIHRDEHAFSAVDAAIDRLQMPERAEERPRGIVDLSRARIGSFEDWSAAWPPPAGQRARSVNGRDIDHLVLDGLVYDHLTNPSGLAEPARRRAAGSAVARSRLEWLDGQSADAARGHFRPQCWMQLAERLAAQGYGDDASAIHIARRRRERASRAVSFGARWQSRLLDWFALYGFNPWRTVLWMIVLVGLFAGIWGLAARQCAKPGCMDESVMVVTNRDAYTQDSFAEGYPPFNALAYSFDLFVPLVGFGYDDHWRPNVRYGPILTVTRADLPEAITDFLGVGPASARAPEPVLTVTVGGLLYLVALLEMVLGLVLTSLAVTGFTGLLRSGS